MLLELGATAILFGAALSLIRYPGAFLAALLSLVGMSILGAFVAEAEYRHDALWLGFVISLHWIVRTGEVRPQTHWPAWAAALVEPAARVGGVLLFVLLGLQIMAGAISARAALLGPPTSQAREFGAFVAAHPELREAVLIADPDDLLEAMPYYIGNPTYLVRETRYGAVVHFTRRARLSLGLPDLLAAGRQLHAQTGRPVVILVGTPLDPAAAPRVIHEAYDWEFRVAPADVAAFLAATRPLGHFAPAKDDGNFDAYLLN